VAKAGIEPATHGFSERESPNKYAIGGASGDSRYITDAFLGGFRLAKANQCQ